MLALLIASPMCWCGWMHGSHAAEVSKPSCCQDAKSKGSEKKSSEKPGDCPCSQLPKVRDVASGKISVPVVPVTGEWLSTWNPVHAAQVCDEGSRQIWNDFLAHGPPPREVKLFVQYCSLLV
jgi:hypothetical protein